MAEGASGRFAAPTHRVTNQPPPLEDLNLYDGDAALREGLHREGGAWAEDRVRAYAGIMGSARVQELVVVQASPSRKPPVQTPPLQTPCQSIRCAPPLSHTSGAAQNHLRGIGPAVEQP